MSRLTKHRTSSIDITNHIINGSLHSPNSTSNLSISPINNNNLNISPHNTNNLPSNNDSNDLTSQLNSLHSSLFPINNPSSINSLNNESLSKYLDEFRLKSELILDQYRNKNMHLSAENNDLKKVNFLKAIILLGTTTLRQTFSTSLVFKNEAYKQT